MFCPKCGFKIDNESKFCPKCGERIDPSMAESLREGETSSRPVELKESPKAKKTNSVFKKKKFWIAAIAIAAVIIAAVVVIIVLTASSVDRKLVGLWYSNDDETRNTSFLRIERSGKCSGTHSNWFGPTVAFKGECKTKNNILTIEIKEVASTYAYEEDVFPNDKTIGYLIVAYQYNDPVLSFSELQNTGKGYFAHEVLCANYKYEDTVFIKIKEDKDTPRLYKEIMDSWFTDSLPDESETEHYTVPPEITSEPAAAPEPETTTKAQDSAAKEIMFSTVNELMLRTGPGVEYPAIAELSEGDLIEVIERRDGWVHGTYNGKEGWASEQYLTEFGPDGVMSDGRGAEEDNYIDIIKNFDVFPGYIASGLGCDPHYLAEDDNYVYYQVFFGETSYNMVKVSKKSPHIPEYWTDDDWNYVSTLMN